MWGGVAIFVAFAPSWCFSIEAGYLCPSNKPKKACIRPCDTNNFTQSLTRKYHHTATESLYRLCGEKIIWAPTLPRVSYQFGFVPFPICLECKISGSSVFSIFFSWSKKSDGFQFLQISLNGLESLKVPKVRFLGFWQKSYLFRYAFLLKHEVPMFFLYSLPKQHVCKNLVLELWSKNLNAGFFKPQYLTKNLRYEVEFLDMIRGPRKHKVLVGCLKWLCWGMPEHAQIDNK